MAINWTTKSGVIAKLQVTPEEGAYTEENSKFKSRTTCVAQIPWAQKDAFEQDCLGYTVVPYTQFGAPPPGIIGQFLQFARWLPEPNPLKPWQFCTECSLRKFANVGSYPNEGPEGWFSPGDFNKPGLAWYNLTFESLPYQIEDDQHLGAQPPTELSRFVVRKSKLTSRELGFPGGGFYAKGDNILKQPIGAQTGFILVAEGELTYLWMQIPRSWRPMTAIGNCRGKINSNPFDIGLYGQPPRPPETVLFVGSQESDPYWLNANPGVLYPGSQIRGNPQNIPGYDPNIVYNAAIEYVDITYLFRVREGNVISPSGGTTPFTWNMGITQYGTFVTYLNKTSDQTLYSDADLNTLFQPGP